MSDQKLLASQGEEEDNDARGVSRLDTDYILSTNGLLDLSKEQLQELAAFHIFNFCSGREWKPPFEGRQACIDAFSLHIKHLSFIRWVAFGLVIQTFFECPHWALAQNIPIDQFPGPTAMYPSWPMPFLKYHHGLCIESFLYALLMADVFVLYNAQRGGFFQDRRLLVRCICLLFYGIDIIVAFCTPASFPRVAGYCRIAIYVSFNVGVKDKVILCVKTFLASCGLLLFSLIWVFFASWIAVIIFPHNEPEFTVTLHNFHDTLWQMYILITTANFPDVMMAGYDRARLEVSFFIIFLIGGIWFLGNSITGIVFSEFEQEETRKQTFKDSVKKKERELAMACLDYERDNVVSVDEIKPVLAKLSRYVKIPGSIDKLVDRLDSDGDGRISSEEFEAFSDVLEGSVNKYKGVGLLESRFGNTQLLKKSKAFIGSTWHNIIVILALVCGGYFTASRTWSTGSLFSDGKFHIKQVDVGAILADWPFSIFFFVEVVLKVLVLGWERYWSNLKRKLEFLTSLAMIVGMIWVGVIAPWLQSESSLTLKNHRIARWFVALQVLRCGRLCFYIPQYRTLIYSVSQVLPATGDVLRVLFIAMFSYALFGVQLFGGAIKIDSNGNLMNPDVADAWSGAAGYYANNFNDLLSGMVVLFEILIGNNWFEIAEGISAAVAHDAARIYFVFWIIIGSQVFLNIVLAIIIGGFSERYLAIEKERQEKFKKAMTEFSVGAEMSTRESMSHGIVAVLGASLDDINDDVGDEE